eukprot:Blabericola_migrator_1__6502@NODE_327_length_9735_cov_125_899772_g264_i0_p8_GENE_NODE_327_length_9735_cov_125_899772_g264_i0NODE_327_length_9735_cov_125_899772_g264_i0_p8_ORF_typecomplete_len122_score9_23cwf18/PF08315_12/8_9e18DUF3461/PF11944_8/0_1DUF5454/PF17535_2/0_21_NODE_327_length_9735_cov_125_899772_g264_i071317496
MGASVFGETGTFDRAKKSSHAMSNHKLIFRSYVPQDPGLRKYCVPAPNTADLESAIDEEYQECLKKATSQDLFQLVTPSKANADIKRSLAKQLRILDNRTNLAIEALRKQNLEAPRTQPPV